MPRFICDTETDGLLPQLTKIHCIVLVDLDTEVSYDFADQPGYRPLSEARGMMDQAELLVFHNGIGFDLPALRKVWGWEPKGDTWDSLILSRLEYPDIKADDWKMLDKMPSKMPMHMVGKHSVAAWGYRLGCNKGDFTGPWDTWSPRMHEYMIQDGQVQLRIVKHLLARKPSVDALKLEEEFHQILMDQERDGFNFDELAAHKLQAELAGRRQELHQELVATFKPWFAPEEKKGDKGLRYTRTTRRMKRADWGCGKTEVFEADTQYTKIKLVEFNPGSRDHIADRLSKLRGWKPREINLKSGKPKVDDEVMGKLTYPEAPLIAEFLMADKRLGALSEGKEAWLKAVQKDGKLHGRVMHIGTITHRCAHSKPNLGQVPSVRKDGNKNVLMGSAGGYGYECRSLFTAADGYVLLGADASGLQLRCLGHYLARYDGGAFIKILLEGDIHQHNTDALGDLAVNRDAGKTLIYAYLFGAGDNKLGRTVREWYRKAGLTPPIDSQAALGKEVRARLQSGIVGLGKLQGDISARVRAKGYLRGLDGRKIPIRSPHAALNALLMAAEAVLVKRATVLFHRNLSTAGYVKGVDWWQAAHVHDEFQCNVKEEHAVDCGRRAVESIRAAGEYYSCRCPLTGEYKLGRNWAETH